MGRHRTVQHSALGRVARVRRARLGREVMLAQMDNLERMAGMEYQAHPGRLVSQ